MIEYTEYKIENIFLIFGNNCNVIKLILQNMIISIFNL
jgi:hypothetical protein